MGRPGAVTPLLQGPLAFVLVLVLGALARGQDGGDDGMEPPKRAAPTAESLERRLAETKVTVDWKDTSVLDGLNEVQTKSGIRFFFEQSFADFAGKRRVTYDGYAVTARAALAVLQAASGFSIEPDPDRGGFHLKMDPAGPTRAALKEKKMALKWANAPVARAISDIEKKTGLKVKLHETMRSRLQSRKITWETGETTAEQAIDTLFTYPPPAVRGRIVPQKDMAVLIVYDGPAETRADVEYYLDEKRARWKLDGTPLADAAAQVAAAGGFKVELDRALATQAPSVTYAAENVPLRTALDAIARAAGVTWKVEGAKVVLRAAGK